MLTGTAFLSAPLSWSTGIAQAPFTKTVANMLPNQYHKKALEVEYVRLSPHHSLQGPY